VASVQNGTILDSRVRNHAHALALLQRRQSNLILDGDFDPQSLKICLSQTFSQVVSEQAEGIGRIQNDTTSRLM
jgi:hypothetical protein